MIILRSEEYQHSRHIVSIFYEDSDKNALDVFLMKYGLHILNTRFNPIKINKKQYQMMVDFDPTFNIMVIREDGIQISPRNRPSQR